MNEILLYLLSNMLTIYVQNRFANTYFREKNLSNLILILCYIGYYVVNSIAFLTFHNTYINFLTNVIPLFLISLAYKSKLLIKIIYVITTLSVGVLLDSVVYCYFDSNLIIINSGLITSLLLFFLELLIENLLILKNPYNIKILHLISILIVPLGSIIILSINTYAHLNKDLLVIQSITLLIINFMIFLFYDLIIKTYEEKIKIHKIEQKNQEYLNQIELNTQAQQQISYLRHDMVNHLQRMDFMLKNRMYQDLEDYISKYLKNIENTKLISNSGNIDIDSILNYKLKQLNDTIPLDIHINVPKHLNIDTFDLTIILGNLLDNSIEALETCTNKYLSIKITYDKGIIIICIQNSYSGKIISKGKQLISTKHYKNNHGIGLHSILNALQNYDGELNYTYNDNLFEVKIIMFDRNTKEV